MRSSQERTSSIGLGFGTQRCRRGQQLLVCKAISLRIYHFGVARFGFQQQCVMRKSSRRTMGSLMLCLLSTFAPWLSLLALLLSASQLPTLVD